MSIDKGVPTARRARATTLLVVLGLFLSACSQATIESYFVPKAETWDRWTPHDEASTATVNHRDWDRLIKRYVAPDNEGVNRFAYGKVTIDDLRALEDYITLLEMVQVTRLRRDEQYAYWANLYNAVTVRTILQEYPVASIRDINDGFLSPGPWDRKLVTVEGTEVSLNDIESRILRPIWDDPRTHYAINCASVGCPNLQLRAFTGDSVEAMLDEAAREYVNNWRGVFVDGDRIVASSIYAWFKDDFGGSDKAVLRHLKRYAGPKLAAELDRIGGISGYAYSWALNGAS